MKEKITFQGALGAFSHIAAGKYFGLDIDLYPALTFDALFKNVSSGKCGYGVVPIENSTTGSIHQNYDLLTKSRLHVVGEVYLRISHNLMAMPGVNIKNVTEAYSHPQGILQCQNFFRKHPWIAPVYADDTALSAKMISQEKLKNAAAIASAYAAELYHLKILANDIQSNKANYTRFWVIAKRPVAAGTNQAKKISVMFSIPHRPGSLSVLLDVMAAHKLNMTRIERDRYPENLGNISFMQISKFPPRKFQTWRKS